MSRASALILLLILAGCASAGEPPPASPGRGPPAGDNGLFISPAGEPFRSNGAVSPLSLWFGGADANHDGRLTLAEFTADHERFFNSLDLNGDGVLDGQEIDRYEQSVAPELLRLSDRAASTGAPAAASGGRGRRGGGGPRGGGQGGRGAGGRAQGAIAPGFSYGLLPDSEPVRSADLDLDFKISLAEWRAAASRRFAQLDANHDAALTLDELHWPRR